MKYLITLSASTKFGEYETKKEVELASKSTFIMAEVVPKGFRGYLSRLFGVPPIIQVEISPVRKKHV